MKILKFGGTSVGTPGGMKMLEKLVPEDGQHWMVLSALAGTTDRLLALEKAWINGNHKAMLREIEVLEKNYEEFVFELFDDPRFYKTGKAFIEQKMARVRTLVSGSFNTWKGKMLVAEGELISTGLFYRYIRSADIPVVYVCASDLITKKRDGTVDMVRLQRQISLVMSQHPEARIFITQGFICRDHAGNMDNLGRGGSDFTATLLGNVLDVDEIQIWTDVDGMHNNDPRVVEGTAPVTELSFDEADELAYFGAKVLYPRCVFPAKQKNIPIRIKNTINPEAPGTVITQRAAGNNIKAVAGKDGITAIRIRSGRMLMAYGFLKKVFEIFEKYETPIDMITTSEVSVSLSVDDDCNLEAIEMELNELGSVEVERDQSIICVVGDFMASRRGMIRHVLNALKDIPLRMVSYGGSMNNVSLLVSSADKKPALEALHHYFFINHGIHVN
ncbi:MAG: aspartate kinase [Chlorobi bacterium]|nr:aspartate kinase [Chlorobiota bacterium]